MSMMQLAGVGLLWLAFTMLAGTICNLTDDTDDYKWWQHYLYSGIMMVGIALFIASLFAGTGLLVGAIGATQ